MRSYLAVLYLNQLVLGALTFTALRWTWLSLLLSAGYLVIVLWVALDLRRQRAGYATALVLALLWQAPGLLGTLAGLGTTLGLFFRVDILDFVMQTWHMPLLPWTLLLPTLRWHDAVLYYWVLVSLSPLLVLAVTVLQQRARSVSYDLSQFRPGSFSAASHR